MRRYSSRLATMGLSVGVLMALALLSVPSTHAQTPGIYISLGDSIAAGVGSSLPRERGNAALIAEWLRALSGQSVPLEQLAVPGETATTFMEAGQIDRLRNVVGQAQAAGIPITAVTVSLGGNELLSLSGSGLTDRDQGLREFYDSYNQATAAIRNAIGAETPLIALTLYDPTGGDSTIRLSDSWWIAQFNEAIRTVTEGHGGTVADIAAAFADSSAALTHYPYDVHPTNAGHLVIAREVWATLALDTEPPTIVNESEIAAFREMVTVRFSVADNVGVATVDVTSDEAIIHGPYEIDDGEYAVLMEFQQEQATLSIEIRDDVGNITTETVTVRR